MANVEHWLIMEGILVGNVLHFFWISINPRLTFKSSMPTLFWGGQRLGLPHLAWSCLDLVQDFVEESQRWEIELSDSKERMRPLAALEFRRYRAGQT